jgi:hypothetical protein
MTRCDSSVSIVGTSHKVNSNVEIKVTKNETDLSTAYQNFIICRFTEHPQASTSSEGQKCRVQSVLGG